MPLRGEQTASLAGIFQIGLPIYLNRPAEWEHNAWRLVIREVWHADKSYTTELSLL